MSTATPTLRAYAVRLACRPVGSDYESTINATSASKARVQYWRNLDCDYPYLGIRSRVLGPVQTSDDFARCATYRGVPFAKVGMRVRVGEKMGTIVGHNSSANFNVLFDGSDFHLNCHPNWHITYFDEAGAVVKSFPATQPAAEVER